ncbi:MAG: hypothetical protein OP8BY_0017 [Candidatus Saccharicenans subterraneus]|uniref:Uncharacterized protein n=1 Tax=Candidatus Saccharicenans subterraneus TaxID=2508984 RepID=A0A3E2BLW1_9BACT|nr:MAG: hypothetical protein OP8BY_0017 [Candidatus Saccharicenans subterraneum]
MKGEAKAETQPLLDHFGEKEDGDGQNQRDPEALFEVFGVMAVVLVSVVGSVTLVGQVSLVARLVVTANRAGAGAGRDMPGVAAAVVLVVATSMGFMVGVGLFFMTVMLMVAMPACLVVMACMVVVVGGFSFAMTMSPFLAGFRFVVMLVIITSMEMFMGALVFVMTVRSVFSATCSVTGLDVALLVTAGRSPVSRARLI